jgi:serine/threonine-protein kinase HipA
MTTVSKPERKLPLGWLGVSLRSRKWKARILTTNIDLDEGTRSVDLFEAASEYFGLSLKAARALIREVAPVARTWQSVAAQVGARGTEINRIASAFEHTDLRLALQL